jgi:hypothetical protein
LSLFASKNTFPKSTVRELENLLRQSHHREELQKATIESLLQQLGEKYSNYPIFKHPKIVVLLNALNVILVILQNYQTNPSKFTPTLTINAIREQLVDVMPSANSIRLDETRFKEELDKRNGENYRIPKMEETLEKWQEAIEEMKEATERIKGQL